MEGGKKRKRNPCCGFQGLGQETSCQKLQQYGEGKVNHYCLKHYNQSLQHQQGMEQPHTTNPVDGHTVSASSCIWQYELHLNKATTQPHSKIQSMQQQTTMVSMVTSSIHPSAFSTKN
jgi:hypothetical protein